ncbi:MAG: lycopene cyclase family protein [Alkalispirochaeta sp.]
MERYDYILAGGGAAGLSLAFRMVQEGLDGKRILIIDLARKSSNDHTWCFWSDQEELLDPIVAHRWSHIWFHGPDRSHRWALNPYEYRMIRGSDFYEYTQSDLSARDNVTFVRARVTSIADGDIQAGTPARVTVEDGRTFEADWVFDSLFFPQEFQVDTERFHFLKQHFVGWTVRTAKPVFDPDAATMFDLRVPCYGDFRFMYLLPVSPTESLVEYTLFSSRLLQREEYESELREYMARVYPDVQYEVVETEDGVIPMTEQPFPRRGGQRIMYTGTKGGRVKASTGFAFHRTQEDSTRIVRSLVATGSPFHGERPPRRYRTFDAMLLSIMDRRGEYAAQRVFVDLFEKNPLPRLWRFLDEYGTPADNIALMSTVPWMPFIAAWFRVKARALGSVFSRKRRIAPVIPTGGSQ